MHWIRHRLAKLLAGIVIAGLAGTWAIGAVRDQSEVARMTEKMKTVCVGRFLLDLPEEAEVELFRPRVDGFEINSFRESDDEFHSRVAERESQLRAIPDRLGGNRNLETVKEVKTEAGLVGKIFVHGRTVTEGTQANGLEIERYRYEGIDLEGLVHANGVSFDITGSNFSLRYVGDLPKLITQLIPNTGNQIPAAPGFCIDHAYVREPLSASQREEVVMAARLPSHPDIEFLLIVAAGVKPAEQGLLERNRGSRGRMSMSEMSHVSTIRATSRDIDGIAGDELVQRFTEDNSATVYNFWWEVPGTRDDVMVPHISLTMDTGKGEHGPVPSSLSEGVALGLWEKISSSLRVRPTAVQKAHVADPISIAIGTHAMAGEVCPQSGWWQCSDTCSGVNVLGGQRQYLCKGQKMPQALLLPPQTLWQRIRGLQASYEVNTRTSWKLADKRERDRNLPALPLAQATLVAQASSSQLNGNLLSGTEPGMAIGCIAKTGMRCPASGWWRCEESQALDGTRWFAVGSLLPAATFEIPSAAFGRAFGRAQAIQRRSVWQLVRQSDTPDASARSPHDDPAPPALA